MSTLREGHRISNYLLEARVGSGSFGEVWRARHHVFDETVAIKIPTDPQYVRNLRREGVAARELCHPNIVRVIDLDPSADPPYLVMEYVEGPSLREAIDALKNAFPIAGAIAIMRGVLHALDAAHNHQIIHRDIKPANILLSEPVERFSSLTERSVKITDFGLGHIGGATTHSIMQSGSVTTEEGRSIAGTIAYMSPEQKEGLEVDERSDLYSCGIVLFEMLTGERPQGNDVPSVLRPEVPPSLDQVFTRCYTRRERRYSSAREAVAALSTGIDEPRAAAPAWIPPGTEPKCPDCEAGVHSDDQFCIHCGRQLVEAVPRCASCHAYVNLHDRYCIICGTDLRIMA